MTTALIVAIVFAIFGTEIAIGMLIGRSCFGGSTK
jgi:hypothetical protein